MPIRKQPEEENDKSKKSSKPSLNKLKQQEPAQPVQLPRMDYETRTPNPYLQKVIEPIANKWFELHDFKKVKTWKKREEITHTNFSSI